MDFPDSITKNVVFESTDYAIVENLRVARALGGKGFSAALRQIIREWNYLAGQQKQAERPEVPQYRSGSSAIFSSHAREG